MQPTGGNEAPKQTAPPKKTVDTQKVLKDAQSYFDRGKYDEGIRELNKALNLDPSNAALLKAKKKALTSKAAEEKALQ